MITLISGENSFENDQAVRQVVGSFAGDPERVDGGDIELKQLPDLLSGVTLFNPKRLVIIKNLSENKTIWNDFADWIPRISDDVQVVLVEAKPDKRTKTYKELQKVAEVKESTLWSDRDTGKAEQWVMAEATRRGFTLDKKSAHTVVTRVGTDQWLLSQALEKLAVVDTVTPEVIEELTEANPVENVFMLFESALRGDARRVKDMLITLEVSEDAYKLLGLLSGQAVQLAVLAVSDRPSAEVAKDMGVHPYALSKLAQAAKKLGRSGAKKVIAAFAEADTAAKSSAADPWLLVERALIKVACL